MSCGLVTEREREREEPGLANCVCIATSVLPCSSNRLQIAAKVQNKKRGGLTFPGYTARSHARALAMLR